MKELTMIIKGLFVTIAAYSVVAAMIFVYTDTNIVVRILGAAVCIIGDFVWKWFNTELIFEIWKKKLDE